MHLLNTSEAAADPCPVQQSPGESLPTRSRCSFGGAARKTRTALQALQIPAVQRKKDSIHLHPSAHLLGWLEIVEGPVDLCGALSLWRCLVRKHVYQLRKLPASVQNHVFFIEQMIQIPVTRTLNCKEMHSWVQSPASKLICDSLVLTCAFFTVLLKTVTWELLFLAVTLGMLCGFAVFPVTERIHHKKLTGMNTTSTRRNTMPVMSRKMLWNNIANFDLLQLQSRTQEI